MKRLFFFFAAALALSCGDREATVVIDRVNPGRSADQHISIEVVVRASEQAGRTIGRYCVSFHVFAGDATITPAAPAYYGEYESQEQCAAGLDDGDERKFFFVSARTDIPVGLNIRAQTLTGGDFQTLDVGVP